MVNMLVAYTEEIDDVEAAVAEVLEQLDMEHSLGTHSAGILTCYAEFIETGVVRALCERLPFDVIGCTTLASATGDATGALQLCLSVITGDDLRFASAVSPAIAADNPTEPIRALYRSCRDALGEEPSLALAILPMMRDLGGEIMAQALYEEAGDVPVYGTISCDHTPMFNSAFTIHNGQAEPSTATLLLIAGPLHPRFLVSPFPEDTVQKHRAVITEADGYVLKGINGKRPAEHMEALGMTRDNGLDEVALRSVAFFIDYGDGAKPVARSILSFTEEGNALCCGIMPVDATLALGSVNEEEVLSTTAEILDAALAEEAPRGMLLFSCASRNFVLDMHPMDELDLIRDRLAARAPYQASYSGGELCPVYTSDGHMVNRFHNFTCTACVF